MQDYYSILGVSRDADEVVIRAAYKALAQKYHPDKSSPELFVENSSMMSGLNSAYSTLSDKEKRRLYDMTLSLKTPLPSSIYKEAQSQTAAKSRQEAVKEKDSQLMLNIFLLGVWVITFWAIFKFILKV